MQTFVFRHTVHSRTAIEHHCSNQSKWVSLQYNGIGISIVYKHLGVTARRGSQELLLTFGGHTFSPPLIVAGKVGYVGPMLAVGVGIEVEMIEPAAL